MKNFSDITIMVATADHVKYVDEINDTIEMASKERGTGIARRTYEYLSQKILEGKAVIALEGGEKFAGFCYIESWGHNRFVANSGLIVKKDYRGLGLAKKIKHVAFRLSREKFPDSKIFGLTTGLAVMKINTELGYRPVTFSELTDDKEFWKGCQSCVNYDILQRTNFTKCLCTGMLYDPAWENEKVKKQSVRHPFTIFKQLLTGEKKTTNSKKVQIKVK
ncbi:MAG: GNAT family N-acetyltransferase [Bacteroidota bacterium]|nr:GNAT family N-acetyltransferase [Bacteroidota bacterium]